MRAIAEIAARARSALQRHRRGVNSHIVKPVEIELACDDALRFGISVKTVETHRTQLIEQLDVHDVPGLARVAQWARATGDMHAAHAAGG